MIAQKIILYIILSITVVIAKAQTTTTPISISDRDSQTILNILKDLKDGTGVVSNLKVSHAYLSTFIESADYGPMWYGDTIVVNQSGYLVQYEYRKETEKSNWKSSENIFIPNDKSAIYRKYTCQFGGIPPSFGFANRRSEWTENYESILSILNKKNNE